MIRVCVGGGMLLVLVVVAVVVIVMLMVLVVVLLDSVAWLIATTGKASLSHRDGLC